MEKKINEEELGELREYLENEEQPQIKKVKIIFDGKQTNIRIPADFVEIMEIDPDKDLFEFKIDFDDENKPFLLGRLIKND